MILPHLSYCNIVWGNCGITILNRLFILQKRAIRVMCNVPPLSHSSPLFKKTNILTVYQINQLQVAIFMYSYFKGILPKSFNDVFTKNSAIHSYSTRAQGNLRLPLLKYNFSKTTIVFIGSKCWNSIPDELKSCPSLSAFKRKCKAYILRVDS